MPLKFDISKCTGCEICMVTCSSKHFGVLNSEKARLRIIHENNGDKITSKSCIFCKKCEKVCQSAAISNNGRWMIVDQEKCIGCGTCIRNCPTKVIFLSENKSIICDLCGGNPQCIECCPEGVISLKKRK